MPPDPIRILIVEDNPGDVHLIKILLKDSPVMDSTLTRAATKLEAFRILRESEFDIILLDLNLPDSFGIGTCDAFLKEFPNVPLVVLTGVDDEVVGKGAVRKGAQDYLVKGQFTGHSFSRSIQFSIDRYKYNQQLKEGEERYRLICEGAHDLITLVDKDGNFKYVNASFERTLGYSKDQLIGMNLLDLICREDLSGVPNWKSHRQVRFRLKASGGEWMYVEGSSSSVNWRHDSYIISVWRDITERVERDGYLRKEKTV